MKVFNHVPVELKYGELICETLSTGRTYVTPEGNKYPSITTVLGILGEGHIQAWRERVGEAEANRVGRIAANRGTMAHWASEKILKNEPIDKRKLMPNVLSCVHQLEPVLLRDVDNIQLQEKALYSDHLQVAGRVDLIAEFRNKLSVIDVKTSNRVKTKDDITSYFMQETGYAIMFEERTGIPISQLVTIMAVDGAKEPLIFIEKRDNWTKQLRATIKEYQTRKMFGR